MVESWTVCYFITLCELQREFFALVKVGKKLQWPQRAEEKHQNTGTEQDVLRTDRTETN